MMPAICAKSKLKVRFAQFASETTDGPPRIDNEFAQMGDAKDMANIFHHNRLDLVTVFLSGVG